MPGEVVKLPVFYLGDNDWAARVLFVQPPREQGDDAVKTRA